MHTLPEAFLVSEVVNVEELSIEEEEYIIKEEAITPTLLAIESKIQPTSGVDFSSPTSHAFIVGNRDISRENVVSG